MTTKKYALNAREVRRLRYTVQSWTKFDPQLIGPVIQVPDGTVVILLHRKVRNLPTRPSIWGLGLHVTIRFDLARNGEA